MMMLIIIIIIIISIIIIIIIIIIIVNLFRRDRFSPLKLASIMKHKECIAVLEAAGAI